MNKPKLITTYVHPPIPIRDHDWCCYEEGEEESALYGWGRTEKEAVEAWELFCSDKE